LHPALIPFPFAFLFGAAAFDLAALWTGSTPLSITSAHLTLAGIGAGLVAAVPGAIDYLYSVPPNSSGKKRATQHGALNVGALVLFGLAFAFRHDDWTAAAPTLLMQLAGALVLGYAGWLGGTLVTRNLIGVDHRYANAGKWQELSVDGSPGQEVTVGREEELREGQMKLLHVNGRRVALARTPDGVHAVDDGCTHRGGSLAGGVLVGHTVQCLWHGSQFDVRTGDSVCGPARNGVRTHAVRLEDGRIVLTIPK
jgi:nitrite reductase/ring-hydroxylating ferredoxin subunit/uncharacterized membrane protein